MYKTYLISTFLSESVISHFWWQFIDRVLERGVSVECQDQIFYRVMQVVYLFAVGCRNVGVNFECRVSGIFCSKCRVLE